MPINLRSRSRHLPSAEPATLARLEFSLPIPRPRDQPSTSTGSGERRPSPARAPFRHRWSGTLPSRRPCQVQGLVRQPSPTVLESCVSSSRRRANDSRCRRGRRPPPRVGARLRCQKRRFELPPFDDSGSTKTTSPSERWTIRRRTWDDPLRVRRHDAGTPILRSRMQ